MTREPVKSGLISSIGHNPETNTLAVEFKSGAVYHYGPVTSEQYEALKNAESVGKHFNANMRGLAFSRQESADAASQG